VSIAFVAGATGYVGREVVRELAGRGVATVAHVRPDSPRLEEWRGRFQAMGATVDATPWDADALGRTFAALRPDVVFCLIGTTRARSRAARRDGRDAAAESYTAVDLGLTRTLIQACAAAGVRPRFVYLSAAGTGPGAASPYGRARHLAEAAVRASGLPSTIVRPGLITGPDREESRPMERGAAIVLDGMLRLAGGVGARELERRWRSIRAADLAAALVRMGLDPAWEGRVAEVGDLRA
jgi:nucleoside-diphosphate-sugar epimerase